VSDTSVLYSILAIDRSGGALGSFGSKLTKVGLVASAAFLAIGAKATMMAANFQTQMNRVQTGAGEFSGNMKMVGNGVLSMAGLVGQSTTSLTSALYTVESAGYHGAEALTVLKNAAEGAKVGNAELATVGDAVTTGLNAYHLSASKAVQVTNALIGAEAQGKTNMEALAGSLATVLPTAAAAHVGLNEVLGAMSTMTAEGTPAAQAATYLRQTIAMLENPSAKATDEMKSLGLNAITVAQNLGKNGLASTLTMLTTAITAKMGPAGTVLIDKLQSASKNTTAFQKVLANLNPTQQTYVGALATMVGGTKSMQGALELTGSNMKTFQANTAAVAKHVKDGGSQIEGWSLVQKSFNQKLAEGKGLIEAYGIKLGQVLLPYATKALDVTMQFVGWLAKNKTVVKDVAIAVGLIVAAFELYKLTVLAIELPMKIWLGLQTLLDAAMDANPIGLIVIAVAALAAGIYYLWTHSAGFRNFFIGMWHDIWGFLKTVGAWFAGPFAGFFVAAWQHIRSWGLAIWGFLKAVGAWFAGPFVDFFVQAWHDIAAPALWLWHNILDPLWRATVASVKFVMRILTSLANLWRDLVGMAIQAVWVTVIRPVFDAFAAAGLWLWNTILKPTFDLVISGLKLLGGWFMWIYHDIVMPVWNLIGAAISWLYHSVILPIGFLEIKIIKDVGAGFAWLWHTAVEPAVHGIAAAALWVWHNILDPAWNGIKKGVSAVGSTFKSVFGAVGGFISGAFSAAVGFVKSAINTIIDLVNGAIGGIDSIITKANSLPGVNLPKLPKIPHLAAGGIVHARPGGTLAVLGEAGRDEMVTPLSGSGRAAGGPQRTVVEFRAAPGDQVAEMLLALLRPVIRGPYGGSVDDALAGFR